MPNYKPTTTFTEDEVRTAFIIGLATGHSLEEISSKIFAAAAPSRTETDRSGERKPVDDSSRLATALNRLATAGYMSR